MPLDEAIRDALISTLKADSGADGLSEQVLAAKAREILTRQVPGVTFNEITAHRDGNGRVRKVEVDYMDEVHDPSPRSCVVDLS